MTSLDPSVEARFWKYVVVVENCWEWVGGTNGNGYGVFTENNARVVAHRFSYKSYGPGDIKKGLEIDHLCRNRRCVNPAHLEAVSHAENVRRGLSPAAVTVRTNVCAKGHELTEKNTIIDKRGKRMCRACKYIANENWRRKGYVGAQKEGA